MPCYDGRDEEARRETAAKTQAIIDKLTRLLCESEKLLRNTRMAQEASPELKQWWVEHRKVDQRRSKDVRRK